MMAFFTNLFRVRNIPLFLLATMVLLIRPAFAEDTLPTPRLNSDTDVATAGFYRLTWETPQSVTVELEEADNPAFENASLFYRGADSAAVITGKPDGVWFYRIRALGNPQTGPWSQPVRVAVEHHSISRALMFFGLGIVVFLATLSMILLGERKSADDLR